MPPSAPVASDLAVHGPFDGSGLLDWFGARAIPGVEEIVGSRWRRAVRLPHGPVVLEADLGPADGAVPLTVHLTDARDASAAADVARRLLDLGADPVRIDHGLTTGLPALATRVRARPGVRIPGVVDVREALLWAVVGQQVTVQQTRDQIARATDLLEDPLPEPLRIGTLRRLPVDPVRAAAAHDGWFRGPGARRRALLAAAAAPLGAPTPPEDLEQQLLALPGVGPWTAGYVLLRAGGAPDLAPPRDAALLLAARDLGLATDHADLARALEAVSPWRSYAALHLWHHAASLSPRRSRR